MSNLTDADREALGRIIWETSRADESTISYAGANIVADAVLVSDWFQARVAEARADERERIAQAIEARETFAHGNNPESRAHVIGFGTMRRLAARIAREGADR